MEDDDKLFSQKSFALVYVKKYKFNTYRKNGRVSSIVSRMVIQPLYWYVRDMKIVAYLITIERKRNCYD